jgi:Domain of unknown function (DUF4337)
MTRAWGILRPAPCLPHVRARTTNRGDHAAGANKKVALVIVIIALFLAFSELLGKSANTEAITLNILASDTWNFFQAKNIRRTVVLTAAETLKAETAALGENAAA